MANRSQFSSKLRGHHVLRRIIGHCRGAEFYVTKWLIETGQLRFELIEVDNDRIFCSIYLVNKIGNNVVGLHFINAYFDFWTGSYDAEFTLASKFQYKMFFE